LKGFPGVFGLRAFEEVVLKRLLGLGVADFVGGGDLHAL
jgi:hypothetical protein